MKIFFLSLVVKLDFNVESLLALARAWCTHFRDFAQLAIYIYIYQTAACTSLFLAFFVLWTIKTCLHVCAMSTLFNLIVGLPPWSWTFRYVVLNILRKNTRRVTCFYRESALIAWHTIPRFGVIPSESDVACVCRCRDLIFWGPQMIICLRPCFVCHLSRPRWS